MDHDFLKPEAQRLGAYHVDRGNNVYYKGERLGDGPFKDIGDGWASGGGGTLYFHGQEVELSSLMQAVVLRGQFHNAGNGYGIAEGGRVFYAGKEVDIGPITGHQTELDHLGDGWSRTSKKRVPCAGQGGVRGNGTKTLPLLCRVWRGCRALMRYHVIQL